MLNPLVQLTLLVHVVKTDFQYIHWNSSGSEFPWIHELTDDWYSKLAYWLDDLGELAMELNLPMVNLNDWQTYLPDYVIENSEEYADYKSVATQVRSKLLMLIQAAETAREYVPDEDVKSRIDDFLRQLKHEANYKLAQTTQVIGKPVIPINFVSTGLDNRVAFSVN